jgi:phosphate transport system substrate-binding protein
MPHARAQHFHATLLAAAIALVVAGDAFADPLIVQGSTTFNRRVMEPHKGEIERESGHELTVIPNKSRPGLMALLEGRAHMAMISDSLASELAALQPAMPGLPYDRLQVHAVQQTRVAIALHPTNPVRKASLDQVRKMILGQIGNWAQLGGQDQAIRVVFVGGGGGVTSTVLGQLVGGRTLNAPHILYVRTPVHLVQVVEQEPGAIGFAQVALAKQRNLPELQTDRPVEQTLSFVTLGAPTPAMQDVIDATRRIAAKMM